MEKLKLFGVLLVIVILFQIPFLTYHDDIYSILNMILTVVVYLIGIKNIKKDTTLKKVILYGFILLWCVLMILISYCMWGHYLKNFSIIDAVGWGYSVIIVLIISKILSLEAIQEKINYSSKYLIITTIVLFIVGGLVGYGIEYIQNYKMDIDGVTMLLEIEYYVNISVFSILLFHILKINIQEKRFIILSTSICIVIILIFNIIPILKINNIISSQEKLSTIINSNLNSYTYKTIETELGQYLLDYEIEELTNQTWDYQQYDMMNKNYLSFVSSWVQDVNKKNFKQVLNMIQSVPNQLNEFIDAGKVDCNYRMTSIIISSIIVGCMGGYLILKEN